jgi:tetratricopeptide (TPR) repeat protein
MKFISTASLTVALALGAATAALVAPQAAVAKSEKAPKITMSEPVRKAMAEAQAAIKANDAATAQAKIAEAKAAAKTDDDRYVIGSVQYDLGKTTNDQKAQAEAIDAMLQSGKVPAANQGQFNLALGQLSYTNKDYPKAEQAFQQALQIDPSNMDAYALLAETKYQLGKSAEAVGLIQRASDSAVTSGKVVPKEWYARGIQFGMAAKLADPVTKLTFGWLRSYPEKTNWRDALVIYRDLHAVDAELNLDFMRLQRAVGALRGERDFAEYAEATYLKFPNEAKSVVDEGVAAGAVNPAQSRSIKELSGIAAGRIAGDKASLKKSAANGRAALGIADAYASYGDYASAVEMYDKAVTLGGIDANIAKLRKGAALARSGQKDAAKQVLSTVTGPRADLAQYWILSVDHPPAA